MPVVGWLSGISEQAAIVHHAQLLRGLEENGFAKGRDVSIQYRWAEGNYQRLPALADELARLPVDVILAQTPPAALAAKAATATIPIVFVVGIAPVIAGLVTSYNRPGGNATGATMIMATLGQKRIEILRELAPRASVVAMLVHPHSPDSPPEIRDVQAAVTANGLQLELLNASTPPELDAAFAALGARRPGAFLVGADPFPYVHRQSSCRRSRAAAWWWSTRSASSSKPAAWSAKAPASFHQAGIYVGRFLNGAKPADLPVVQPTTFELVVNLKTAKAQGIDIPAGSHARSDEVIEQDCALSLSLCQLSRTSNA